MNSMTNPRPHGEKNWVQAKEDKLSDDIHIIVTMDKFLSYPGRQRSNNENANSEERHAACKRNEHVFHGRAQNQTD